MKSRYLRNKNGSYLLVYINGQAREWADETRIFSLYRCAVADGLISEPLAVETVERAVDALTEAGLAEFERIAPR